MTDRRQEIRPPAKIVYPCVQAGDPSQVCTCTFIDLLNGLDCGVVVEQKPGSTKR